MLVDVRLRVCVSVCAGWCLQVELPTVLKLEREPAPRGGLGGLAQTVSLARPGAARRPPGGLGMGADDLPSNHQLATDASTFSHHLTS
jgi:hypothetical protein